MTGKKVDQPLAYQPPERIFEFSGSVHPEGAYYVPLENVTNTYKQDIKTMVDKGRYFSIFAPRQSGKTTLLAGIHRELHKDSIGEECKPEHHPEGNKRVISLVIGIGKP